MTSHYLDLHLRPDPELAPQQLLAGVYARLHHGLVQLGREDIGVSFPGHDAKRPSLGSHLRLHGPEAALSALMATPWLRGLHDHVRAGAIATAPADAPHRVVSRVQAKSNVERLRRRAMKRHGLDAAAARERIPAHVEQRLALPFVMLGSRSTGQASFPLFVRHGELQAPSAGAFTRYGLSQRGATVPWF